MKGNRGSVKRIVIALLALSCLLPTAMAAAWDPGEKMLPDYMRGSVKELAVFPIYVFNFTPYDLQCKEAVTPKVEEGLFLPGKVAAGSMGVGYVENLLVTQRGKLFPKPFSITRVYKIMESDADQSELPGVAVKVISSDDDVDPPEKSGLLTYLKIGVNIAGSIGGLVPEIGIFFRMGKMDADMVITALQVFPKEKTNFYIFGYPMPCTDGCVPSVRYYPDYCSDPDHNQNCGGGSNLCFDSAYTHTDPDNCRDADNNPDPSSNYVVNCAVFSGAPFYSDNDEKKPFPAGTQTPHWSVSVCLAKEYFGAYQEVLADSLRKKGLDEKNPNLKKVVDYILATDLKIRSRKLDQLGMDKAAAITRTLESVNRKGLPAQSADSEADLGRAVDWLGL